MGGAIKNGKGKMLMTLGVGILAYLSASTFVHAAPEALAKEDCGAVARRARDYFNDEAFRREFRDAAIGIARRKKAWSEQRLARSGVKTPFKVRERMPTGGGFDGFFVWDSAFGVLWGRYVDGMPVHGTLDNFYDLQQPDGFICREYDCAARPTWKCDHPIAYSPPLFAWAEIELFRCGKSDKWRLETVYPKLVKFHECYDRHLKRPDGLYFSDMLGSGMDDLKRWPHGMSKEDIMKGGIELTKEYLYPSQERIWNWIVKFGYLGCKGTWNRQAGWIDLSAQMAFDCMNLAYIAKAIGNDADVQKWAKEYKRIKDLVNEKCWDDKTGFYYDYCDSGLIMRKHAGAFWTLLAKIPDADRVKRMVETITDPRCFWREFGPPALSADDPDYDPINGYWQGPIWPPTTYVLICGLRACGETEVARKLAHKWYNANAELYVRDKTVYENIPPVRDLVGKRRRRPDRDFCGWGALAPVAIPAEWPIDADSVQPTH
jgi:hypothetical protein